VSSISRTNVAGVTAHCTTTSLVTWLVNRCGLVSMNRLVTRQVTHVTRVSLEIILLMMLHRIFIVYVDMIDMCVCVCVAVCVCVCGVVMCIVMLAIRANRRYDATISNNIPLTCIIYEYTRGTGKKRFAFFFFKEMVRCSSAEGKLCVPEPGGV